jgi:spore coat protein A
MCAGRASSAASAAPAAPPRPPLHPDALESFVDPLPIPAKLTSAGVRPDPTNPGHELSYYRVTMREASVQVHRDVPPTRMWTYEGSMPGPTIETRSGAGLLVEWVNELPARHFLPIDHTLHGAGADQPEVRAVVHVHGAKAPPASDGYPEAWTEPGHSVVAHYPNRQEAATLWYHDHTMGIERLNQYAGLLGCFIVRDDVEDALDLPRGDHEIPLVLCDRQFFADGDLRYPSARNPATPWVAEFYGDASLVNGKLRPYVDVEPRAYRFRVVNASNARPFALRFADGRSFHQIGTDQGLLPAPVALSSVLLSPAERADLVVDFAGAEGQRLVLQNAAAPLLQLRVAGSAPGARGTNARTRALPRVLRPMAHLSAAAAATTRTLTLNEYHDAAKNRMLMLLDGKYWHDPVTERPVLGTTEVWSLVNLTEDAHPIHLHLVRFQILDRQPFDADEYNTSGKMLPIGDPVLPAANEAGWKDTVRADPGMVTRIIARFDGFSGRYVWHCHILEHAANEMMRPFEVIAPA